MAHRKMILTEAGAQVYRNRMLTAGSPVTLGAGDARVFAKHGWATEKAAKDFGGEFSDAFDGALQSEADDLTALRAQYQEVVGKKPYHGWDTDTLREKIAAA